MITIFFLPFARVFTARKLYFLIGLHVKLCDDSLSVYESGLLFPKVFDPFLDTNLRPPNMSFFHLF